MCIPKRKVANEEILSNKTQPTMFPKDKEKQPVMVKLNCVWIMELPAFSTIDYLRVSASVAKIAAPQIAGSMRSIYNMRPNQPEPHEILICPIIDMKSDSNSCVYSTLLFVIAEHKKLGLPGKPFVTFDQPLFKRASVIARLMNLENDIHILIGNFHNQLSYFSAVGYLMKNSGFEELLQSVYGETTVKAILCGNDYERAVRCHGLVATVLKQLLLEQLPSEITAAAATEYESLVLRLKDPETVKDTPALKLLVEKLGNLRSELEAVSQTNQLWFTYLDWYDAFLENLHSERLGQWSRYTDSLKMMPTFLV